MTSMAFAAKRFCLAAAFVGLVVLGVKTQTEDDVFQRRASNEANQTRAGTAVAPEQAHMQYRAHPAGCGGPGREIPGYGNTYFPAEQNANGYRECEQMCLNDAGCGGVDWIQYRDQPGGTGVINQWLCVFQAQCPEAMTGHAGDNRHFHRGASRKGTMSVQGGMQYRGGGGCGGTGIEIPISQGVVANTFEPNDQTALGYGECEQICLNSAECNGIDWLQYRDTPGGTGVQNHWFCIFSSSCPFRVDGTAGDTRHWHRGGSRKLAMQPWTQNAICGRRSYGFVRDISPSSTSGAVTASDCLALCLASPSCRCAERGGNVSLSWCSLFNEATDLLTDHPSEHSAALKA